VLVYRLLGPPGDPAGWERTQVDTYGSLEAQVVDLDLDGLPDIVGHDSLPGAPLTTPPGQLSIWYNRTTPEPAPEPADCATAPPSLSCACGAQTLAGCGSADTTTRRPWTRLSHACSLFDRATARSGARAARLERRTRRVLRRAVRSAAREARRGSMTPDCATAFARLLEGS
jgi:hypothetical protein